MQSGACEKCSHRGSPGASVRMVGSARAGELAPIRRRRIRWQGREPWHADAMRRLRTLAILASTTLLGFASALRADEIPAPVRSAVEATDRSDADRALDGAAGRKQLLAFFGIRPGMRLAELAAGGGYTAELLARVVDLRVGSTPQHARHPRAFRRGALVGADSPRR